MRDEAVRLGVELWADKTLLRNRGPIYTELPLLIDSTAICHHPSPTLYNLYQIRPGTGVR